jgi:hypothetical protein
LRNVDGSVPVPISPLVDVFNAFHSQAEDAICDSQPIVIVFERSVGAPFAVVIHAHG